MWLSNCRTGKSKDVGYLRGVLEVRPSHVSGHNGEEYGKLGAELGP